MEFAFDLLDVNSRQLEDKTESEVHSLDTWGQYFPALHRDPNRFVKPIPEFRNVLARLRSEGKQTFLATNSHYEQMEVVMSATLGPNWKNFFDFCLANCKKPLF